MTHGSGPNYPKGPKSKYGNHANHEKKVNDGPGKNGQHNDGGHHSQKTKGNKRPHGGGR